MEIFITNHSSCIQTKQKGCRSNSKVKHCTGCKQRVNEDDVSPSPSQAEAFIMLLIFFKLWHHSQTCLFPSSGRIKKKKKKKNKRIPFRLVFPCSHFGLSLNFPHLFRRHLDLRLKCVVHHTSCKAIPPLVIFSSVHSTATMRQILTGFSS